MTEQTTELIFFISSRKRRIAAFAIDFFLMMFLMISIIFIVLGPDFTKNNSSKMIITMLSVMIPIFLLYFAKDSLKGISIGKWIMGIMIRDESNSNEIPSFGRLFLRNLFIIIYPIEFIVLAISEQKKRLGDKFSKTVVVINPNKASKVSRVLTLISVVIVFFSFIIFSTGNAIKNSEAYKIAVTEIEKSEQIRAETGGIKGYGIIPSGSINISNEQGQAQLEIKVLGNTKDINVSVYLEKEPNEQWKIIQMQI